MKYHEDFGNTLDFDFGILQLFLAPMIITRDPQNVTLGYARALFSDCGTRRSSEKMNMSRKSLSIVIF